MIDSIVQTKRDRLAQREKPLNRLFGMQNYIDLGGSADDRFQNQFDITKYAVEYCTAENRNQESLVIVGGSGAGKSLFLVRLAKLLNTVNTQSTKPFRVVLVKLRDLVQQQ